MTDFATPNFSTDLSGDVAFITGTTSGLGARFARVLASCGAKVACSSLKAAFEGLLDIDLAPSGGDPHQAPMPTLEVSAVIDGALVPGVFAFAFVRNPWDRLVSCYRDKIGGEVADFTHFTQRPGVADCLARFPAFTAGMSFAAFVEAVTDIDDHEADPHFRSQ